MKRSLLMQALEQAESRNVNPSNTPKAGKDSNPKLYSNLSCISSCIPYPVNKAGPGGTFFFLGSYFISKNIRNNSCTKREPSFLARTKKQKVYLCNVNKRIKKKNLIK